jgi:hypothetical protein
MDKPYFYGFLFNMAAAALFVVPFFIWWWTNRRIPFSERLYGFIVAVGIGAILAPFCDKSTWFALATMGLPIVLTVWTLWMALVKKTFLAHNKLATLAVVAVTWGCCTLIRIDGLDASLTADFRWRWTATEEDKFLAWAHDQQRDSSPQPTNVQLSPGDWFQFRGPDREGVIRGVTIATDWSAAPPTLRWRHRVGPAWSSVIVIGDRLYTQEQRGPQETVVCYDATTGKEIWVHEDPARFWETVSGAGPRATPTFSDGRIYSLGGTGILNCLDAATGQRHWSRDTAADASAATPMWGFSSSPLISNGIVITFAGGSGGRNLLGYRAETGALAWTAPVGHGSYSSPQLVNFSGTNQCLMLTDDGLYAVDPTKGTVLWKNGVAMPGAPRVVQSHRVGDRQLVGTFTLPGTALIEVTRDAEGWKSDQVWTSSQLKPEFPDFVVHEGHAYGFDTGIFCCINLADGKRSWKEGRYGRGQVMLLADQSLLLVISETGEAILLPASPDRHQELARFNALEGKTWNHPVIAHGRMYVRNAQEMACYDVQPK